MKRLGGEKNAPTVRDLHTGMIGRYPMVALAVLVVLVVLVVMFVAVVLAALGVDILVLVAVTPDKQRAAGRDRMVFLRV